MLSIELVEKFELSNTIKYFINFFLKRSLKILYQVYLKTS